MIRSLIFAMVFALFVTVLCSNEPVLCDADKEVLFPQKVLDKLKSMDETHRAAAIRWLEEMHRAATAEDGEDLLKTLRPQHPRLMLLDSDIERVELNIRNDPTARSMWESIHARATRMLSDPPAQVPAGETDQLELSRTVLKRVYTLAGAYRLTHDKRYFDKARSELLRAAAMKTWDPAHFLDVAEMTNAVAIGYDWLYNDLSFEDRKTIKEAIVRLGLNEGVTAYQRYEWWTSAKNNWNPVCNGGLVAGALAVADEEPRLANRILNCVRVSLPLAMASFAPDGGWAEGPGYWSYCTRYVAYLNADLKTALSATDLDFTKAEGLARTGYFRIYFCGPVGKSFNFADATEEVGKAWQNMWLSDTFANQLFAGQELVLALDGPDIFHLLFHDPNCKGQTADAATLPLNAFFKGVNVAFLRNSWTDPETVFIGFKGGDNKANHSHLDLGTFVMDAAGCRWALDLGPDNYHLPGYFGKERFTYYRLSTRGHNCITIDNENQNVSAKAPIIAFSDNSNFAYAIADLHEAYSGKLTDARRGIALMAGRDVLLQDELTAPSAVPICWHWHTRANVTIASDGHVATLEQTNATGKHTMYMRILSPAGATFTPLACLVPQAEEQQRDVTDINISLTVPPKSPTTVAVLISPDSMASQRVTALEKWSQ